MRSPDDRIDKRCSNCTRNRRGRPGFAAARSQLLLSVELAVATLETVSRSQTSNVSQFTISHVVTQEWIFRHPPFQRASRCVRRVSSLSDGRETAVARPMVDQENVPGDGPPRHESGTCDCRSMSPKPRSLADPRRNVFEWIGRRSKDGPEPAGRREPVLVLMVAGCPGPNRGGLAALSPSRRVARALRGTRRPRPER